MLAQMGHWHGQARAARALDCHGSAVGHCACVLRAAAGPLPGLPDWEGAVPAACQHPNVSGGSPAETG